MASGTIDNRVISHVLAVVDEDSPNVDEDEEKDVCEFLKREQEGVDVVRKALSISIERVESVRGVRRRHDPLVVRLVETLVHEGVVQSAVDPVDAEVGEHEEEGELHHVVPHSGGVVEAVVYLGVTADFEEEERGGEDGHYREGDVGLAHLEADLVLEVFGVVEGCFVEDEEVGERGEDIVDDEAEDPGGVSVVLGSGILAVDTYQVMRNNVNSWRRQSSRGHWLL